MNRANPAVLLKFAESILGNFALVAWDESSSSESDWIINDELVMRCAAPSFGRLLAILFEILFRILFGRIFGPQLVGREPLDAINRSTFEASIVDRLIMLDVILDPIFDPMFEPRLELKFAGTQLELVMIGVIGVWTC